MMHDPQNVTIAARLEEVAALLEQQGAIPFRVEAYRRAAETVFELDRPVAELLATDGVAGLERLPTIGPSIARAIRDLVTTGRLPLLDRLRGESDSVALLASVPGIGNKLAERLHEDHGIDTLEELEAAAYDGLLDSIPLIGAKRLRGIREALATRLGRGPRASPPLGDKPSVADILAVDREYRRRAAAGSLRLIAPRRMNPRHEAWLPVLHTLHGERAYTALFSNTARAHELGKTHDWVVIYVDGGRGDERQYTVVTQTRGPLTGKRVVRGQEVETAAYYRGAARTDTRSPSESWSAG